MAATNPRQPYTKKSVSTIAAPINPSSSQITAKIKSVCASGRKKSFWRPSINPTPVNPPEPMAMSDCNN